jgi:ribonuclease P protein subunit POP4
LNKRFFTTDNNFFRYDLIGLHAKIIESSHQDYIGIKGKIVDETEKTLIILDDDKKKKRVAKKVSVLQITLPNGKSYIVDGVSTIGRPVDRIKKRINRRGKR